MKPSRNAFLGYTYQEYITYLMLAKMDVERQIEDIEIEAIVNNNFDDIKISIDNTHIYCQIKDYDNTSLDDLTFQNNQVLINGKAHILSSGVNILFLKKIDIPVNTHFLGFPAYKTSNLYIISLSREQAGTIIKNLYKHNEYRESIIDQFFKIKLDKRQFCIKQKELPTIDIFDIQLLEKTIDVGKKLLEFENIIFIEGKPGVGKSHLVDCLASEYENCLKYRFWISNQDKDYNARLFFHNFLSNISKELFQDYQYRSEDEIINYLYNNKKTVIIDGLDHVENYQNDELASFIKFIDKLKVKCKTIILSRPLKVKIEWTKQQLVNWNFEETKTVLNKLYHISDYQTCRDIFDMTDGYPILVRFVTEHYKQYGELPLLGQLNSIDDYYGGIISNTNILSALTLFLSTRSFIMESEISLFLEDDHSETVKEFIKSHPYLFEIKLNRISLFHDSLNTFLRNKEIAYSKRSYKVNQIVHKSLMNGENRFMSRFASFDLDKSMKIEIIKKYVSISYFQEIINTCIDIEAIRTFYKQIRESLTEFDANELEIINYYDLALIINITQRDHIWTVNEFLYTYVKSLLFHEYGDDDITSSEHLFCMYYYYKTKDATLLHNLTSDSHFNTENFYQKLEYDVWMEENYFARHLKPIEKTKQLKFFINQEYSIDTLEYVPHLLANLYLHETKIEELKELQNAIKTYLDIDENFGIFSLEKALQQFRNVSIHLTRTFLTKAKDIILSLGKDYYPNEYHSDNLHELILKNSSQGSFTVWPKVLNYIRLSLFEKRKIDLSSIGYFYAMYGKRKDYSVFNIGDALKVFEDKGLISIDKAIDIIRFTQSMSEKGIRHLLSSYVELHSPDIISILLQKHLPDRYQITWFDLSPNFINQFSDYLFNYAMNSEVLRSYSYNKEIDFKDIQNVFYSRRKMELIKTLNLFKYRIKISVDHPSVNELQSLNCSLSMSVTDRENKYLKTAEERYAMGILDSESIDFIKEKALKVEDIAGYADDDYSVFSDLKVFHAFSKEHVKENASLILHNALIGRIERINMFASLYHFPGNIPKFVNEYGVEVSFADLYKSFMCFLEISLLKNNPQLADL
jgi:hypothetical protein